MSRKTRCLCDRGKSERQRAVEQTEIDDGWVLHERVCRWQGVVSLTSSDIFATLFFKGLSLSEGVRESSDQLTHCTVGYSFQNKGPSFSLTS